MFKLPELKYSTDALEPHIDTKTMEIHHSKHHGAYVNNLNAALEKVGGPFAEWDIITLMQKLGEIPESVRNAVRNNGGGHYNHTMFWELLTPGGSDGPTGALKAAIEGTFQNLDSFKNLVETAGLGRFGSGWAWLVLKEGKLAVTSTANQDNPIMDNSGTPILGIDVWEHAYYLKYQNRRADYLKAIWNVLNWREVEARYSAALIAGK